MNKYTYTCRTHHSAPWETHYGANRHEAAVACARADALLEEVTFGDDYDVRVYFDDGVSIDVGFTSRFSCGRAVPEKPLGKIKCVNGSWFAGDFAVSPRTMVHTGEIFRPVEELEGWTAYAYGDDTEWQDWRAEP